MKVRVLFFAQLREAFGSDEVWAPIQPGMPVADLAGQMMSDPRLSALKNLPLIYAVNEQFVPGQRPLNDADVVAFLTPVAGGAV